MKVPVLAATLYKALSPLPLRKMLLSSPLFSLSKHYNNITTPTATPMATCVDISITNSAPQVSRNSNRPQADQDHVYKKFLNFSKPFCTNQVKTIQRRSVVDDLEQESEDPWLRMQEEAKSDVEKEPILSSYYYSSVLSQRSLESALANHLAIKLSNSVLSSTTLCDLFLNVLEEDQEIVKAVKEDLRGVKERDPACMSYVHCFLNFKGFLACQAQRIAHKLWTQNRQILALLIQNRTSEVFSVDIHPGAKIGKGILIDHATGVVVGETAEIGDNVSILHNVTLGGTGKVCGDRHPKIGNGVLIGAGTCILGNIKIGDGAKIGAGSVVLKEVPARTTAVGNPARLLGGKNNPVKLDKIPSFTMDHTSHLSEWSDYII